MRTRRQSDKENHRKTGSRNRYDTARVETTKIDKLQRKKSSQGHVFFVIYVFIMLFMGLMGYLIYGQFVSYGKDSEIEKLIKDPRNPLIIDRASRVNVGSILASDGETVLAKTVINGDNKVRQYPQGEVFAHPVGYASVKYNITELESSFRSSITEIGSPETGLIDRFLDDDRKEKDGNSIVTTLNANLQRYAYEAMGDRKGAIVMIEPSTGKIIAMVSKPSFDPNSIDENWNNINNDNENSPLLNRAISGLYTPGSTFKVLTAIEYMRENPDYEKFSYLCNGEISKYGLAPIACAGHVAHGTVDIRNALVKSCNGAFITMGLNLNLEQYRNLVEDFGFNNKLPFDDLYMSKSKFMLKQGSSYGEVMQTSFGQGDTLLTPMQNAVIASTIANDGKTMQYTLKDRVIDKNRNIVDKFEPRVVKNVLGKEERDVIASYMRDVATSYGFNDNNVYDVACKTGTAQYNNGQNTNQLLIGFAPVDNPKVAFSIVLEDFDAYGGNGEQVALGKELLRKYFIG